MIPHPDDHVITIASTPVVALPGEETLREAAERLRSADVGALVILGEDGRPLGIFSERDVVRALADGADPDEVWATDVMTEERRYATPGESIRSVGEEMARIGVRHLPILDQGEVVGLVAEGDVRAVMSAAAPRQPPDALVWRDGRAVERELAHPGG